MSSSTSRRLARIALATALIIVCSQIIIPLPGVPFTLQTLAVGLVACLLVPLEAMTALLLYLFMGAVGLPVFAGASGGFSAFFAATGGFLIGFIPFVLVTSYFAQRFKDFWTQLASLIVGDGLAFFVGWLGLMVNGHLSPGAAFLAGVVPFIIIDLVKMFLVALMAQRLRPLINR